MVTHPYVLRGYAGNLTGFSVHLPPLLSLSLSLSASRCSRVTLGISAAQDLNLNEPWLPVTSPSCPSLNVHRTHLLIWVRTYSTRKDAYVCCGILKSCDTTHRRMGQAVGAAFTYVFNNSTRRISVGMYLPATASSSAVSAQP